MGAIFFKVTLMGAKFAQKTPLKGFSCSNLSFQFWLFSVKNVKIPPLWVPKVAKPYPYGCF